MSGDGYFTGCKLPSSLQFAKLFIEEDVIPYGSVVSVRCHIACSFDDGSVLRTFVCTYSSAWHVEITDCKREYITNHQCLI